MRFGLLHRRLTLRILDALLKSESLPADLEKDANIPSVVQQKPPKEVTVVSAT